MKKLWILIGVFFLISPSVFAGGKVPDYLIIEDTAYVGAGTDVGDVFYMSAYDTDTGPAYVNFITFTSGTDPTCDLSTSVTIGGANFYYVGGTDVALGDGGTGASLSDPGADRIFYWDDGSTTTDWLIADTNHFQISSDTLSIVADGIDDTLIDWGVGANQVSIADLSGNQISGALLWDLGGASSLEIPNAEDPTVNVNGQIAMDNNADEADNIDQAWITYYDGDETQQMYCLGIDVYPANDTYIPSYDAANDKLVWADPATLGTSPGGADTQVQYNNAGSFGGDAGFTYNAATDTATIAGDIVLASTSSIYIGDPSTNGTWKLVISGSDLEVQLREGGSYVRKFAYGS